MPDVAPIIIGVASLFVVALFIAPVFSMNAFYGRVFSAENLVEIASGLANVKPAVLGNICGAGMTGKQDESWLQKQKIITKCGLTMVYSIEQRESAFVHHISMSREGGRIAHAAAMRLAPYILTCLGIPSLGPCHLSLPPSKSGIQHMNFSLTEEQQDQFRNASVFVPSVGEALEFWKKTQSSVQS